MTSAISSGTSFVHAGISVADLDRAVAWYADRFGFREIKRFEKAIFEIRGAVITLGETSVELLEPRRPLACRKKSRNITELFRTPGTNHIAIEAPDITAIHDRLTSESPESVSDLVDGRFFFCVDPDGTAIEVRKRA